MKLNDFSYKFTVTQDIDCVDLHGIVVYEGVILGDLRGIHENSDPIGEFKITRVQNTFEHHFYDIADAYDQFTYDVYTTFFDLHGDLKKPYLNDSCCHEFYVLTDLTVDSKIRLNVIEKVLGHFIRYHCTHGSLFVVPATLFTSAESKVLGMKKIQDWRYVFQETHSSACISEASK